MHQGSEALPKRTPPGGREACGADDRNKLRSVTAAERRHGAGTACHRNKLRRKGDHVASDTEEAAAQTFHLYQLMPPTMWSERNK